MNRADHSTDGHDSADGHDPPMLASGPLDEAEPFRHVSRSFLQTVVDSFPHCVIVLDLEYRIVMANRAAQELGGQVDNKDSCLTCYRMAHHRETPCEGTDEPCPLKEVVRTRAPVRVYHKHHDASGKRIYMAIDAAPIFDESGEVVQVIESCRDVTERTLWRRVLRIGNRHMEMQPLLDDFCSELENYTKCAVVGIRLRDDNGGITAYAGHCPCNGPIQPNGSRESDAGYCLCRQILEWEEQSRLQPVTEGGSIYVSNISEYLAALGSVFSVLSQDEENDLSQRLRDCGCESLAIVPIIFRGQVLGVLHVADPRPDVIPKQLVESLEEMSMELGTAIQRVRAEEELRSARDGLEARVEERTAELTRINRALQDEILERTRLEREIMQISAKEQQRIGQELHDELGQELTGLSYLAHSLFRKLRDKELPESEKAGELAQGIPRALGQVRSIVKGLIPMEVTVAGVETALLMLLNGIEKQTGIKCSLDGTDAIYVPDDYCAVQFYRITQEAVNNAIKHGKADQISVVIRSDEQTLRIEIRDNGIGISTDAQKAAGCGLRIMRYRARAVGGKVETQRMAQGGTLVACTVPRTRSSHAVGEDSTSEQSSEISDHDR